MAPFDKTLIVEVEATALPSRSLRGIFAVSGSPTQAAAAALRVAEERRPGYGWEVASVTPYGQASCYFRKRAERIAA